MDVIHSNKEYREIKLVLNISLILLLFSLQSIVYSSYEEVHELEKNNNVISKQSINEIAAGLYHTCAIHDDGSVTCWGRGLQGQIGDGSSLSRYESPQISSLGSERTALNISAGDHTCAILDDDSVSCWGLNDYGQLGDGTNANRNTPTNVSNLGNGKTAIAISAGGYHSCAILDDGTVTCWGAGTEGRLGDGTNTNRNTPAKISSLGDGRTATAISSGLWHTCVILDDGTVTCWGSNFAGKLGDGTNTNRNTPTKISSLGDGRTATAISAGGDHTCAILDDGSVSCWGWNEYGQLGDGTNTNRNTPTDVSSLGNGRTATAISAGGFHTCAILDDGTVTCWGSNFAGKLGDGTNTNRNTPTQTSNLGSGRTAVSITTGDIHTCAILDDGSVSCWGSNTYGQLGDGTTTDRNTPTNDSDEDGITNDNDDCPNTTERTNVNVDGCASYQLDSDSDGVSDRDDDCPNTASFDTNVDGCASYQLDSDGDGVSDRDDDCPNTTERTNVNVDGCSSYSDSDGDGVVYANDDFPHDANETTDTDGDGIGNNADDDDDGDGYLDIYDQFPFDSTEWFDTDGDGVGDNADFFPSFDERKLSRNIIQFSLIILLVYQIIIRGGPKLSRFIEEEKVKMREIERKMREIERKRIIREAKEAQRREKEERKWNEEKVKTNQILRELTEQIFPDIRDYTCYESTHRLAIKVFVNGEIRNFTYSNIYFRDIEDIEREMKADKISPKPRPRYRRSRYYYGASDVGDSGSDLGDTMDE